ncbi:MAG: hypothetical protein PWQ77_1915 [Kosmotogales bacterium]|nr:hypothetical protein [Kosmotogales bacterium]
MIPVMKIKRKLSLQQKYPPSQSCSCDVCKSYCLRPGWWTVDEAAKAIEAGYGKRMMLELSPDFKFGVLSPAFYGCEQNFALQEFSHLGCNFLSGGLCELYGTGFEPLECRFCHHTRKGLGPKCHSDIEKDWKMQKGQTLIKKWLKEYGIKAKSIIFYK